MRSYFLLWMGVWSLAATEPKILYEEDPTLLVTSLSIVVHSGAAEDPMEKVGISNLLGELMLRGTRKRDRAKFQQELETMGATLGASASGDGIAIEGKVIRENTGRFLALVEEALTGPAFNTKEFGALKKEAVNAIQHQKNANNRLGGLLLRKEVFAGTPLQIPVSGSLSTLKKIDLKDLVRAYNDRFHRGNLVFAVAAALPKDKISADIKSIWKKLPDGLRKARKTYPLTIPKSPLIYIINKPKTSTGSMIMAQAGITAQDPLRYHLNAGNYVFGGEPLVCRLFRTIRGDLGYTYMIGSGYGAMGGLTYQQGLYTIISTPSMEFTGKTLFKALSMWNEYVEEGLHTEELELSQESLVNAYPFEFESAEKRLSQSLYSYLYDVPVLDQEKYAATINAIDKKNLKEALKMRHLTNAWIIAIVADAKEVEKQLAAEQKDVPEEKRLKIHKIVTPDQVIE